MERLFILALLVINVQLVVADCDFDIVACVDSYNNCVAAAEGAGNSPADICTCYGTLLLCYRDAGCMSESDYNNTVQDCPNSRGCTIQQCLGIADTPIDTPVSEPVTFTPVASSTCNNTVADACLSNYFTCVGSGSQDKICNCYGPYLYCYFYDAGCLTLDYYDNAVQLCEQFNCTAEQCTSPISSPISYTPVDAPVSSCNFNDVVPCQDRFINCTTESQASNETCDCYGPYLNCVYDTGCITLESYWNAVQSCEQSGCSLEQCTDNGPVTPPVDAPYYTPYSEPVNNSTCSQSATMECYDTKYQPCWNGTDFCECYGPYLYCLYELQCFNNTEYSNIIDSCTQNGCSYQQCANTGVTPVEPPQTTVPVSEPTSVSPISAPFAPPTAVICLQPWELVLIVVGSVLAGIGLAAIVGVIIYLSRGSSAKKTSTKYAKLQRY